MAKKIAILEDNVERAGEMLRCLQDRFHQFEIVLFQFPTEMRSYCEQNLQDLILIGLDHDIELSPGPNGRCTDHGTGRDVAEFLATKKPVCPIVIHTSNGAAGDGMERTLQERGWKSRRVVPHDDLEWIATDWFREIRNAIVGSATKARAASAEIS